jgi:hypothetical protein
VRTIADVIRAARERLGDAAGAGLTNKVSKYGR